MMRQKRPTAKLKITIPKFLKDRLQEEATVEETSMSWIISNMLMAKYNYDVHDLKKYMGRKLEKNFVERKKEGEEE